MKPIRMYLSRNISKEEFLDRFGPLVGSFCGGSITPCEARL